MNESPESPIYIAGSVTYNPDFFKRVVVVATIGNREPDILSIRHPDRLFRMELIDHGERERGLGAYQWLGSNKFVRLHKIFTAGILDIDDFDYFWFPDDDIADMTHEDVCKMIGIAYTQGKFGTEPRLFQPSLSAASQNIGWPQATQHRPGSVFRYTNFVEPMMPCFRRDALKICLPTFLESDSAYGLDFVWAKLLDWQGLGVVDAVAVRHMHSSPAPASAWADMGRVMSKYGLSYDVSAKNVQSF